MVSGLRAGELAAAAGVNRETLRYYERRGLLDEPERSSGGHRVYPDSAVSEIRFIKAAQALGFTLEEIRDLCRAGGAEGHELREGAVAKLAEVESRMADLCAVRDTLRAGIAGACDDPSGYLRSPDFRLVNGPRVPAPAGLRGLRTDSQGGAMGTVDTDEPVAVAVVAAIRSGDLMSLRALLGEHRGLAAAMLGDEDPRGMARSLLHVVTDWPGHYPHGPATVAVLVEAGADVNARFRGLHAETPLHWAASNDDVDVLDALLDAGADIEAPGAVLGGGPPLADARGFKQWKAAHRLVERGARTTLVDAATMGLLDRVTGFFAGEATPGPEEITHAFWGACHGGRLPCAQYLLHQGAELNWIPPWENLTPLDAAQRENAGELVRWLRERGARTAAEGWP